MRLFLKSNRITAILACLRGCVVDIYAQRKLDELDKETRTQDWEEVAIMLVGQEYESTEGHHDYKTSTRTTYSKQEQPIDIGKSNKNFKDGKPKCFNCNKYRYMAKECQSKKKEHETRKCFKCEKEGHIAKDCKTTQSMKKRKIQEELDDDEDKKEE